MDAINVTDAALISAARTLENMQNDLNATLTQCQDSLKRLAEGFSSDDRFISDIKNYIAALNTLGLKLAEFVAANNEAIVERYKKMNEYTAKGYIKRNFG